MDGLFTLLSLSVVMAVASFLAGILPLSFSLSQSQLRLISTIGMGVLVGTSMVVIIPEGIETLYSASEVGHSSGRGHLHHRRHVHRRESEIQWANPSTSEPLFQVATRGLGDSSTPFDMPGPVLPSSKDGPPRTPTKPGLIGIMEEGDGSPDTGHKEQDQDEAGGEEGHSGAQHAWIGVALLAGFMLMYLIDKVPQYTKPTKRKTRTHHIALNNLGRRFNITTTLDRDEEQDSFIEATEGPHVQSRSFATTIGLVIHAAADGIALGASSTATHSGLSFIIFFAIMIHKAPAAFGLTSVLVKQGLSKRAARGHLVLFSLAAPAGAIFTWLLAQMIGGGSNNSAESTAWWTGILLLFSAGTFLYVAMHSMQETSNGHHEPANGSANGYTDGREVQNEQKASLRDLGAACFGMILPLFLQVGHAH